MTSISNIEFFCLSLKSTGAASLLTVKGFSSIVVNEKCDHRKLTGIYTNH